MNLCKYKYLFGVSKQGIHQYRLFGIAIVDTVETIIGALVFSYLLRLPFWWTLFFFFIVAEILHYLFCVDTAVMKFLFPRTFPH